MNDISQIVERPLTEKERAITRWLLQQEGEDASTFLRDLDNATVVGTCPCGCDTVDFAISGTRPENNGINVLSDYYWIDDAGHTNGIFVYSISGKLAGLEVYSCDGECGLVCLPDVERLIRMPPPQNIG